MTFSALSKTNGQVACRGRVEQTQLRSESCGLSNTSVLSLCLQHPPSNMPQAFFFQLLYNHVSLRMKIYLSACPVQQFITTHRGRSCVLCWQFSSQSELIQEQLVLPTHPSQLSAAIMSLMGSVEGLTGTARTRTRARRGWGEKSAVGVGREVSERSWSLQLLAESGSEIILCQSCIYYLDFCNSFPPKHACHQKGGYNHILNHSQKY